ncbi:MAG: hypothetical protein Q8R06_13840 [Polaromonas sp.]|uniref:DUF7832 domain-containing protein n=1 Tax=Polaromonas sp. TaxID=1869339 RepID=UPI0027353E54|nr:hypothetical protein [Polaromonas sp.]MDP3798207.1 hypothetical protein [Polaromonas sp.]
MKYDDASWYFDGKGFPKDLPQKAAATHIGMFVAWMALDQSTSSDVVVRYQTRARFFR